MKVAKEGKPPVPLYCMGTVPLGYSGAVIGSSNVFPNPNIIPKLQVGKIGHADIFQAWFIQTLKITLFCAHPKFPLLGNLLKVHNKNDKTKPTKTLSVLVWKGLSSKQVNVFSLKLLCCILALQSIVQAGGFWLLFYDVFASSNGGGGGCCLPLFLAPRVLGKMEFPIRTNASPSVALSAAQEEIKKPLPFAVLWSPVEQQSNFKANCTNQLVLGKVVSKFRMEELGFILLF